MSDKIQKIAIVGPESTGKTTLAKELAVSFGTQWVHEYARQYLAELDRPYISEDLLRIAKGQLSIEDQQEKRANKYLICDTNLLVLKVWSEHKYGKTDKWIADQLKEREYAVYLLTACDIPWEEDPLRESPEERIHLFQQYETFLIRNKLKYYIVRGNRKERMSKSVEIINNL